MKIIQTTLPGVQIIEPKTFRDERGFFRETWNSLKLSELGLSACFVQDNHCRSHQGTLRGLHYQLDNVQGKLVRVIHGAIVDVVVDLRLKSQTFGEHLVVELNEDNNYTLWIPPGFAHGFYTVSKSADVFYKVTDYYSPLQERVLKWDDPALAINWQLIEGQAPLLSLRDQSGLAFADAEAFDM